MSGAGRARSIVVLGQMTKMPVPGVLWQTLHYLVGLSLLGYDVTYVEAHARTPSMFVPGTRDAGSTAAASFLGHVLKPFGFGGKWAFHALHHDGAVFGMDAATLRRTYRSADLLLNLCGGTRPRPEHVETGRLALVLTDPVQVEVELWQGRTDTREFLDAHCAIFTFGENYGNPDCGVPVSPDYHFFPTRQPVVLEFWAHSLSGGPAYTTVANWHQHFRTLRYMRETYHWSKDREFLKFLELPGSTGRTFELALSSFEPDDRRLLEEHGWMVRDASDFGMGGDRYRSYIQRSRAEFTVAKDQNVRLRSGWFSDRSATYLAAGRPVVTQDTGFGAVLPTGRGLFAVSDVAEAIAAVESIEGSYEVARRAAWEVARSCFDHRVVLPRMLADVGLEGPNRTMCLGGPGGDPEEATVANGRSCRFGIPGDLVLEPASRRPLRLPEETVHAILSRPVARIASPLPAAPPSHATTASVVVVTRGSPAPTRLCLESLLAHTRRPAYEVIVVDNASPPEVVSFLKELAATNPRVRLILNRTNEGFAAGCNQGARIARGETLVFLNPDTIPPPGWLQGLSAPLSDPELGAVNPVTNRSGTEAEVDGAEPRTYGAFLERAAERAERRAGELRPATMLAFFCLALRRSTWKKVGELDEGFGRGLFEDDDYSRRLRRAGLRLACVEGVLVHHFGEASFGDLVADGTYRRLYDRNRNRFEAKWGAAGQPRAPRPAAEYEGLVCRVRAEVRRSLPEGATVAVVSRGDDRLLRLDPAAGWHFPRRSDGVYAGCYPADGREAVRQLEAVRAEGAEYFLVPSPGFWWLEHYRELRGLLDRSARVVKRTEDLVLYRIDDLGRNESGTGIVDVDGPRRTSGPNVDGNGASSASRAERGPSARRPAPDPARPVFIIGSPRSGTSVLTWALGQHPNLYPLEETVWFGRFHAGAVQAFHLGSSRGERSQLSAMGIAREEFLEALGAAVDGLIQDHRSWPLQAVAPDNVYARARSPGDPKRRWVDGTPENSFHVTALVELFPGARFIHLIREPRLVVRSLRRFHNIGGRGHSADEAYRKWISHVKACLEAERDLGPNRVLRLLHRDLASSPERAVRACLDFVGEPYAETCLLPLGKRINSSGGMSLPDGVEEDEEVGAELLSEAKALKARLFAEPEAER